jgi:ABC-type uncharacterized transport system involved in gliding motility auxiliary subunit
MKTWLFPLWIIIDILIGLSGLALWITAPEYRTLNVVLTILFISMSLFLAFFRWIQIKIFIGSLYFRHLFYHLINALLIFSIIGLLNYLGHRNPVEFDATKEKRNSLTEQSLRIISMIKSPLRFTIFAKREEWKPMSDLLKLYQSRNRLITIDAVDTDLRPDLVKQFMNHETNFIISDELSVTNALLKAVRTEKVILYMVTGHQELSCENNSQEGVSDLCRKLESQNYEIKKLDLAKTSEVPKDATAVLVMGPTMGYLNTEVQQLEKYLLRGGNLFLALAPTFKPGLYQNLNHLAQPYGLRLGEDLVVDRLSTVQGSQATIPIVGQYEHSHPITAEFNLRTAFPLSSSVNVIEGNDEATLLAFTTSFPGSWAETDLKGVESGKATFDEKQDAKGPIGLLGVGERVGAGAGRGSRFVLLGSSSFLLNAYQGQTANSTLFLNTLSWLINDEGIISLNRPGVEEHPVILSAQHLHLIFVISILLVPIIFFGLAIFTYRRRRLL